MPFFWSRAGPGGPVPGDPVWRVLGTPFLGPGAARPAGPGGPGRPSLGSRGAKFGVPGDPDRVRVARLDPISPKMRLNLGLLRANFAFYKP